MNFGEKLKILIETLQLRQKYLAANLQISPSTISKYIRNENKIEHPVILALAYIYRVNPAWWTDDNAPMFLAKNHEEAEIIKMSTEEKAIVNKFHLLPKKEQEKFIKIIDILF